MNTGSQYFYHLYEINIDGTGLRKVTSGNYDYVKPVICLTPMSYLYLPVVTDGADYWHNLQAVREIGNSNSDLMKILENDHYGVKLTPDKINRIRFRIDTGVPYLGIYASLSCGMIMRKRKTSDILTR